MKGAVIGAVVLAAIGTGWLWAFDASDDYVGWPAVVAVSQLLYVGCVGSYDGPRRLGVALSCAGPLVAPAYALTGGTTWLRPAMIHDVDGDGAPEHAMSSANHYSVYESDASILWSAPVEDLSGIAAGTAFDFLGDGTAEAMYADEHNMFAFDSDGQVLMSVPRSSGPLSEYPIVVDVDNDGSAEVVVVSNQYYNMGSPGLRVVRDIEDRWIQARRIWNQHTYHVTNVREDGTIPQFEPPHWTQLNTFRTNAQIEGGSVCQPEPEG